MHDHLTAGEHKMLKLLASRPEGRDRLKKGMNEKWTLKVKSVRLPLHARIVNSLLRKEYLTSWVPGKGRVLRIAALTDKGFAAARAKRKLRKRGKGVGRKWHRKHDAEIIEMMRASTKDAKVRVVDIAAEFGVSIPTIRRILRPEGLLRRYHGGPYSSDERRARRGTF